eukprot:scaffold294_cov281-Pinguiococcus_pyrenoidosus.AAC.3
MGTSPLSRTRGPLPPPPAPPAAKAKENTGRTKTKCAHLFCLQGASCVAPQQHGGPDDVAEVHIGSVVALVRFVHIHKGKIESAGLRQSARRSNLLGDRQKRFHAAPLPAYADLTQQFHADARVLHQLALFHLDRHAAGHVLLGPEHPQAAALLHPVPRPRLDASPALGIIELDGAGGGGTEAKERHRVAFPSAPARRSRRCDGSSLAFCSPVH